MNTKQKIMGLAALPLAGLLATGGAALAQGAGAPASTQVVQQATAHRAGDPCSAHPAKLAAQQPCDQQRMRDRDHDGTCGHQAQAGPTATRVMTHARDTSCTRHADH
jgi:hypothetical protein